MKEGRREFLVRAPLRAAALLATASLLGAKCTELQPRPQPISEAEKAADKTVQFYLVLLNNPEVYNDQAVILTLGVLFHPEQNPKAVLATYRDLNQRVDVTPDRAAVLAAASELNGYSPSDIYSLYHRARQHELVHDPNRAAQLASLAARENGNLDQVLALYVEAIRNKGLSPEVAAALVSSTLIKKGQGLAETLEEYRQIRQKVEYPGLAAQLTTSVILANGDVQRVLDIYRIERKTVSAQDAAVLTLASVINGYNADEVNEMYRYIRRLGVIPPVQSAQLALATAAKTTKHPVFAGEASRLAQVAAHDAAVFIFFFLFLNPASPLSPLHGDF